MRRGIWRCVVLSSSPASACRSIFFGDAKVEVFDAEEDVAVALAKYIARLSDVHTKGKGVFTVVLSGGTLIDTMRKLAEPPYLDTIDWSKWHVFWLDERVVHKTDPLSNYKLAYDGFLSKVLFINVLFLSSFIKLFGFLQVMLHLGHHSHFKRTIATHMHK